MLSVEAIKSIQAAAKNGGIPEHGSDDYMPFYDAWGDLVSLCGDFEEVGLHSQSAVRRDVALLVGISSQLPFNGLVTGLLLNQGHLLPEMRAAASKAGLAAIVSILDRVLALLPDEYASLDSDARFSFFYSPSEENDGEEAEDGSMEFVETEEATRISDDLAALEEELDGSLEPLMWHVVKLVAAHPEEFLSPA